MHAGIPTEKLERVATLLIMTKLPGILHMYVNFFLIIYQVRNKTVVINSFGEVELLI